MMRLTVVLTILCAGSASASADTDPIMHGVKGKCTVSRILGEPVGCVSQLVIMHLPSVGRTIFLIEVARSDGSKITVSFSGGKDEQPTLQDHTLDLDKVRMDTNGYEVTSAATGTCREHLNDNGSFSFGTNCLVRAQDGGVYEITVGPGAVD